MQWKELKCGIWKNGLSKVIMTEQLTEIIQVVDEVKLTQPLKYNQANSKWSTIKNTSNS